LGGDSGIGTVFRITPAGALTVLHSFSGGSDGAIPVAGLIQASDGLFYGTTSGGGAPCPVPPPNTGTVFKMTAVGVVTGLHTFCAGSDGSFPVAAVIVGGDGNFYGTTEYGGVSG